MTAIFLFIHLFGTFFLPEHPNLSSAKTPNWVKEITYDESPLADSAQKQTPHLLIDRQINLDLAETYIHTLKKVLEGSVEELSTQEITFDPTYESIILHQVDVYRNGKKIEALSPGSVRLIQREEGLENHLYKGHLSLIMMLSDIKKGDIVEVAYVRKGRNPIFFEHFDDQYCFSFPVKVEKIHYRFLRDKNKKLYFKIEDSSLLQEQILNDAQMETTLLVSPTQIFESFGAPYWYIPLERLQVSDYQSWQEVSEWGQALVNIKNDAFSEVGCLVESWKKELLTPEELVLKALLFVQNEIRYMGMEEGVHSHKPHPPLEALSKGYGDCKDKTLLLKSFMEAMGVASTPCLVSTVYLDRMKDCLPSASLFNHMILKVSLNGKDYWLDATQKYQGGLLKDHSQTFYGCYLLLDGQPNCFVQVPPRWSRQVIEISSHYKMKADHIELEIKTIYKGDKANCLRSYLAYCGKEEIENDFKNTLSNRFGQAETKKEFLIEDDQKANQVTLIESYTVPNIFTSERVFFETFAMGSHLPEKVSLDRSHPLSLNFPLKVKEFIRISSDIPQRIESHKERVGHPGFTFDFESKMEGNDLLLSFLYRSKSDHIKPQDFETFRMALSKIQNILSLSYHYNSPKTEGNPLFFEVFFVGVVLSVFMYGLYRVML
jgi:hypothetical protein